MTAVATLAAFIRRDWLIARTFRFRPILSLFTQIVQLSTFFFLSRMVRPTESSGLRERGDYFGYVVTGLLLLSLASAGLSTFATRIEQERAGGSLEAMLSSPTPPALLVIGTAAYGLCAAVVSSLVMLLVAVVLFEFDVSPTAGTGATAVVAFAATVVWVAAVGVLIASFTILVQRGAMVLHLVIASLPLLGGVYYTVGTLPEPMKTLARGFPFAWGLRIVRDGLAGERADLGLLGLLVAVAVVTLPVALAAFDASLRHVRRTGTLSHF